jgi:hydroxymethylglutaryl-CoA lyase
MTDDARWPRSVSVCEVGPRDGLQMERTLLSVDQKVELIERSVDAGARTIEIGSFVNPRAVPAMADTDAVARRMTRRDGVEYRALVMNRKGVERALDCGITKVKLTASASRTHTLKNMNRTPEQVVLDFADCAAFALGRGMAVSGAVSTAFGCPFEGAVPLSRVESLVDLFLSIGMSEISMSDTSGLAAPRQVLDTMSHLRARHPGVRWTLHLHNTRGLAAANTVAGLLAGVTAFDASFGGLGGCPFAPGASGNIATEDLLYQLARDGIDTGYDLPAVLAIAEDACRWLGRAPDSKQAALHGRRATPGC